MSFDYNNISVPTINYNVSGSVTSPIVQGTFLSQPSVAGTFNPSIGFTAEDGFVPSNYTNGSALTYLRLNLGPIETHGNPGLLKNISGIYIQGTIQKVGNISTQSSTNLKNAVTFEHFGNLYLPYLSDDESLDPFSGPLGSFLPTEFIIKSRTWYDNVNSSQAESVIDYLPWGGQMSNYSSTEEGLIYKNRNEPFNAYPMFYDLDDNLSVFLNCQINFAVESVLQFSLLNGLIVKGTYLLL